MIIQIIDLTKFFVDYKYYKDYTLRITTNDSNIYVIDIRNIRKMSMEYHSTFTSVETSIIISLKNACRFSIIATTMKECMLINRKLKNKVSINILN